MNKSTIFQIIAETVTQWRYAVVGIAVATVMTLSFILITQWNFLSAAIFSPTFSLWEKISFVTSIVFTTFWAQHSAGQVMFFTVIALLIIVNIALLARDIHERVRIGVAGGVLGIGGSIVAVFGLGCSACGSALLMSVFGVSTATIITTTLPLHGTEFGIIGMVTLLFSIWFMARKLTKPSVCSVL